MCPIQWHTLPYNTRRSSQIFAFCNSRFVWFLVFGFCFVLICLLICDTQLFLFCLFFHILILYSLCFVCRDYKGNLKPVKISNFSKNLSNQLKMTYLTILKYISHFICFLVLQGSILMQTLISHCLCMLWPLQLMIL